MAQRRYGGAPLASRMPGNAGSLVPCRTKVGRYLFFNIKCRVSLAYCGTGYPPSTRTRQAGTFICYNGLCMDVQYMRAPARRCAPRRGPRKPVPFGVSLRRWRAGISDVDRTSAGDVMHERQVEDCWCLPASFYSCIGSVWPTAGLATHPRPKPGRLAPSYVTMDCVWTRDICEYSAGDVQ